MAKSYFTDKLNFSKIKVVGVLCSIPQHRLSWQLNGQFEWDMEYSGDICQNNDVYIIVKVGDEMPEDSMDFSFPLHSFNEEGSRYEVHLIQNKTANGYFVPELKQFDYLLIFHGEFDYLPADMIEKIKKLSNIQLAVEIPIMKIKDRHILVSYK